MNLRRILIVLAALSLLVSVASGSVVFVVMKTAAIKDFEREIRSHTEKVQQRIGTLISNYGKSIKSLAGFPDIIRLLVSPKSNGLDAADRILDTYRNALDASVCYIMNADGLTIASSNRHSGDSFVGKTYAFRPYFQQAMAGKPAVYPAIGVTSGDRGIYLSHPVYAGKSDMPVGIVVIKARITDIQKEILSAHRQPATRLCLTTPEGYVFLSDDPNLENRLMWNLTDVDMDRLSRSKQFGKGPWTWSGMKRISENKVVSSTGKQLRLHTATVPGIPGWKIVNLNDPKEAIRGMVGRLYKLIGPLIFMVFLLVGGTMLVLFNKAEESIEAKTRLEASLMRQSSYLKSLHEISLGLINHLEINEILKSTLSGAGLIFDTPHVFIYLLEPDHSRMRLRMGIGGIFDHLQGKTIRMGEGVTGKVWETREALIIEDYAAWPHRITHPAFDVFKTIIGVPIQSQDQVSGVLGIGLLETPPAFSREIVDILVRYSEMIAIALDNSKLYEKTRLSLAKQQEIEEKLHLSMDALAKSEARFRSVIEKNADPIMVVDQEGKIVFANPAADDFFHLDEGSMVGSPFGLPITDGKGTEIEVLNAQGKTAVAEMRLVETEWEGQTVYFASLRDITERKESEKERVKLEAQLRQSQKMEAIGTLAGGIAHDFNNILSAVIGFSELSLDMVKQNDLLEGNLREILNAGIRAKGLVSQILAFSRQNERELKPLQIKLLAKEVLKLLRASLPTTIEIRQNLISDGEVLADPTQIHQVLMNLCTNAGHAMARNGGVLTVSLEDVEPGDQLIAEHPEMMLQRHQRLKVADTGSGIDPGVIDRIFDPFFTTKEPGVGTGMGLSVVHGIIKNHSGLIAVESQPGKGTVFSVYFPLIQEKVDIPHQGEHVLPMGNERVLFVDDEWAIARMGKQTLERLGYRVESVQDSTEALERFVADPGGFDLMITDMTMPNMTGAQLSKQILGIRPDFPIILSTGFSGGISEKEVHDLGIRALLMKPILKKDIAHTVRRVLDMPNPENINPC